MTDTTTQPRERAEYHAKEAERMLRSWWLSTHVQAQVHATLAVYYSALAERAETRSADPAP